MGGTSLRRRLRVRPWKQRGCLAMFKWKSTASRLGRIGDRRKISRENRNENRFLGGVRTRVHLLIGGTNHYHASSLTRRRGRIQDSEQFCEQSGSICGHREAGR